MTILLKYTVNSPGCEFEQVYGYRVLSRSLTDDEQARVSQVLRPLKNRIDKVAAVDALLKTWGILKEAIPVSESLPLEEPCETPV